MLLERAIGNLLDNAGHHVLPQPQDGALDPAVSVRGGEVVVHRRPRPRQATSRPRRLACRGSCDRFYRAATARSKPGAGLGLAIVREAAEAPRRHDRRGREQLQRAPARFSLALPTATSRGAAATTSSATSVGVVPTLIPAASSASFFACGGARRAGDDRARVTHRLAGRRREAGDVREDRLRHVLGDVARGLLLLVAADLADEHDELGLGVGLELLEDVDEARADDRVAADTDDRRVAEPALGDLVADLVRQRPRAGDEADRARA